MIPAIKLSAHINPMCISVMEYESYRMDVRLDVTTPTIHQGAVARPLNLALVFDKSGSMGGNKIETARAAAFRVLDLLSDNDTFCLIAFSTDFEVLVPARRVGGQRDAIKAAIARLSPEYTTKMTGALDATVAQLAPFMKEGVFTAAYVLTDGAVDTDDASSTLEAAMRMIAAGVELRAGGIGDDWKMDYLNSLTADPSKVQALNLDNLSDMIAEFESLVMQRGHLLTANAQLTIEAPPLRLDIVEVNADRLSARKRLKLDQFNTTAIGNLPAGVTWDLHIGVSVKKPDSPRTIPITFRLRYDLPALGLANQVAETTLEIRVVDNTQTAFQPNALVTETLDNIREIITAGKVDEALKNGDTARATGLLGRLTGELRKTGQLAAAAKAEATLKSLEQGDVEHARKNNNRMTGELKKV